MCENKSAKCLCPYCSGSIAKGMTEMNEKNVLECHQLVDSYDNQQIDFNELSTKLDYLNPVQCFDILDQLCRKYPSTIKNTELDQLIIKYLQRFRNNGGFFLALKQNREHLLKRLTETILISNENAQKTNLTLDDIYS